MKGTYVQFSQIKPGAHKLRREVVVNRQRERIIDAAVELIAERGYRAVSVAAIVKQAGVARLKFYEIFSSKQDCFLAAYDDAIEEIGRRVGEACAAAGEEFAARARAGISVLLDFLADRPALARACILEAPSLGAAMGERRDQTLAAFAPLFTGAREAGGEAELPAGLEESVLDGLYWLLYDAILAGSPKRVTELRSPLVEFAMLPFVGPVAAREAAAS